MKRRCKTSAVTGETEVPAEALLSSTPSFSWRRLAKVVSREVVTFLPAWMYLVYGCLLLNAELTNVSPPRYDLVPTVVFPLAVFLLFSAARAFGLSEVRARRRFFFSTAAVTVVLPVLNLSYHQPSPLTREQLLVVYEYSNFVWAALLVWHAWRHERSHLVLFFGVGLLYGMLLENGGIVMGFFHETNLTRTQLKPFVAPVATMVGWSVVLYMATFVVWKVRLWWPTLRRSTLASALLVGVFAVMLDFQIDPIATATGCWVWHSSLPPWFYGVPLVNFVAWVSALAPFAYVMFRIQERAGVGDGAPWPRAQLREALLWVPGAAVLALVVFLSATFVGEGVEGPSFAILSRFVANALGLGS